MMTSEKPAEQDADDLTVIKTKQTKKVSSVFFIVGNFRKDRKYQIDWQEMN